MTPSETPLLTDYVIGYRVWTLQGGVLGPHGYRMGAHWEKGANRARCPRGKSELQVANHQMAGHDCSCGLHAKWLVSDAVREGGGHQNALCYDLGCADIFGAIRGWGRVQIHPDGFRAEYAEILCLLYVPGGYFYETPPTLREVAKTYGVPILNPAEAEQYVKQFGSPGPSDIIAELQEDYESRFNTRRNRFIQELARKLTEEGFSIEEQQAIIRNRAWGYP